MPFVFATCEVGFESALKQDVALQRPELRPAFSRPGLLTFKLESNASESELAARPSAWARVWGRSLERPPTAAALAAAIPGHVRRLHVFARDPRGEGTDACVARTRAELLASSRFEHEPRAELGEWVADVIVAPDEPALLGLHRHAPLRSPWPGGGFPIAQPALAPSRAFLKLEQAIAWAQLPIRAGQTAVEIGSAPGGAALALARRGVTVFAVDPGAMDPAVLAFEGPAGARIHHLRSTMADVRWEMLPRATQWLLCDVNLAPPVALHGLTRLVPAFRGALEGAILTLKMNDAQMRSGLPTWLDRVRGLGFADVEVTHLPQNRNELCCIARFHR